MNLLQCVLLFLMVVSCTSGRRIRRDDDDDEPSLDPTVVQETNGNNEFNCTTVTGLPGICVPLAYCADNYTIATGGNIIDAEMRAKSECGYDQEIWCCALEKVGKPRDIISKANTVTSCTLPESDVCPWCVSLHKNSGPSIVSTGLYCMGAMIGLRAILTAGTCVRAAEDQLLWVRVPLSADPKRNYTVSSRQLHNLYSSGSHAYDVGILVLENDVDWSNDQPKGACLGLQSPLAGECVGYGFDGNGAIVSTLLNAKNGACGAGGATSDAACGTRVGDSTCLINTGSPVLCSSASKNGLLVGVARSGCITEDSALLGVLSMSADWLTDAMKEINVFVQD